MKKYIFTESQVKRVIDHLVNEQTEEQKFTKRVQRFLNNIFKNEKGFVALKEDGLTGPNSQTEKAIMKLQTIVGVYPVDGVWGPETEDAMKKNKPTLYQVWEKNYKPGFFSDWF